MNFTKLKKIKSYIACYLNLPVLYGRISYSQEGEDLIIEKLFHSQNKGFYVDIGAFHPYKYSNTQKLYENGWNGINIDPNKESIKLFNIARKRDINLNFGIGLRNSKMRYYVFEDSALNTFNLKNYYAVTKSGQSKFIKSYFVSLKSISYLKNKYLNSRNIDLINIDTEGFSNIILKALFQKRIRPDVIISERDDEMGIPIFKTSKQLLFMKKNGYKLYSATPMSFIYTRFS